MSPTENDEETGRLAVVVVTIIVRVRHEVSTVEDQFFFPPRIISTRIEMTNNPGTLHVWRKRKRGIGMYKIERTYDHGYAKRRVVHGRWLTDARGYVVALYLSSLSCRREAAR